MTNIESVPQAKILSEEELMVNFYISLYALAAVFVFTYSLMEYSSASDTYSRRKYARMALLSLIGTVLLIKPAIQLFKDAL